MAALRPWAGGSGLAAVGPVDWEFGSVGGDSDSSGRRGGWLWGVGDARLGHICCNRGTTSVTGGRLWA